MSDKIIFDIELKTNKVYCRGRGQKATHWLSVSAGAFGYRRYGRGVSHFGKAERIKDLSKAAREAGLKVVVKKALREWLDHSIKAIKADRDAAMTRCVSTPAGPEWRPYPFQVEDIVKMVSARVILNANPIGSGKSCEALLAAPDNAAILLLSPKSMKGTWEMQVRRWRTDLTPVVIRTKAEWRLPRPGEVVISGYEIIPPCGLEKKIAVGSPLDTMLRDAKIDSRFCLIADEYHVCRKYSSMKTKRVRTIINKIAKANGWAFGLTGSPLMKHPPDLWCLLMNLGLTGEVFGNYESFVRQMGGYMSDGGMKWNGKVDPNFRERLAGVMVLRDKGEVWAEMPGTIHQVHEIDLSDGALKKWLTLYGQLLGPDEAEWTLKRIKDATPMDAPSYAEIRKMLADTKLPAVLEFVESFEEQEEPVVVASAHRHPVEQLGARKGWACIHGGVNEKKRTQIINDFQAGKLRGVAVVIAAGSVGIDLYRANHMVFIDQDWTEELNKQMRGRTHRRGQTKTCYYHHFTVNHPVERRVDQILRGKEALFDSVIERAKEEETVTETRLDRLAAIVTKITKRRENDYRELKAARQFVDGFAPRDFPEGHEAISVCREEKIEAHLDGQLYDDDWLDMLLDSFLVQRLLTYPDTVSLVRGGHLTKAARDELRLRIFKR